MFIGYIIFNIVNTVGMVAASNNLDINSCNNGNDKNCKKTFIFLRETCKNGGAKACGSIGYIYESGFGVDIDIKKAMFYYQKACDLKYNLGCVNLGVIYIEKEKFDEANNLFDIACNNNNAEGCMNLAVSYNYGYGVDSDKNKANRLFKEALDLYIKSCNKSNANDCMNVATMYYGGLGIEINDKEGDKYLQKACNINNSFCD
ncbi:tetratricopeptide repeat protein [Helicobacter sp. MIT 14-3879]|uniref:tetratricopeptide repeat protein n=1 Tax=Helicobacter sp. MIT 14-3879 TaxID=2040649 RepID=UPI000E1E39A4|nr:tetratricopeptide repeat protein [Helicobacter sp. MIT 14-3879]RDU64726.1 hypothetical protein CQA44_03165 [Helicobacter sp. MIT 14-3879]